MKILWLCNIPNNNIAKNLNLSCPTGGGWMTSLSSHLSSVMNIELYFCFVTNLVSQIKTVKIGNITYFVIPTKNIDPCVYDVSLEKEFQSVLQEVKPDLVHIFGTEFPHTLAMVKVCEKLEILDKVVINIQGLCSVYTQHFILGIPNKIQNRYSFRDFLKQDNLKQQSNKFKRRGEFEIEALQKVKHVIGRTTWDKACTKQINPQVTYHFCNEILRDSFYKNEWDINKCEKHSIFISQCGYPIKGFHFLLEAMPIIKKKYPMAHIYAAGPDIMKTDSFKAKLRQSYYSIYLKKLIRKNKLENSITFLGALDEEQMCRQFLKTHVFVSPSTIENSPNSLGEAMILGVPTISSDVGGVKDLLIHNTDGIIYQADAPYMLAHHVSEIFSDNELALKLSENAKKHASVTHNQELNLNTTLDIYKKIIGGKV